MTTVEQLHKQIESFYPLDENSLHALAKPWSEINIKRKQVITHAGDTERYLYMVLDGVQRAFYQHGDREATLVFSYAPSFSGIIDSFFLQKPSRFTLETLTASKFLRIHYRDIEILMQEHRPIETWVRMAITKVLSATLQREIEIMTYSAEEKFTTLLRRSPQVLNLIPHKYLASYIGVDPATFSKLLKTVRV